MASYMRRGVNLLCVSAFGEERKKFYDGVLKGGRGGELGNLKVGTGRKTSVGTLSKS